MVYRVFLDTNVFIYGEHIKKSNSRIIVDLAETGEIEVVTSDALITEVRSAFEGLHDRQTGLNEAYFLRSLPNKVEVSPREIKEQLEEYKDIPMKEFDALHFVASVIAKVDFLITNDEDFFIPEVQDKVKVVTAKKFVESIGLESFETDY